MLRARAEFCIDLMVGRFALVLDIVFVHALLWRLLHNEHENNGIRVNLLAVILQWADATMPVQRLRRETAVNVNST